MKNPNRPKNANADLKKVREYMLSINGEYRTAEQVCTAIGYDLLKKLGTVKSRLRDLKLEIYGGYRKQTRWVNGVMEYRITECTPEQQKLFEEYEKSIGA